MAGQLEDEDYVLTRHISSFRWASGGSSPCDEGEILEGEERPKTWKKLPLSESAHKRSWNKSTTPELGELNREGSEGNYSDDFMEIVVERDRNDSSVRESDTDSENENENDSPGTSEPSAPPLRSVNMLQGCRSVDEFERLNTIDEDGKDGERKRRLSSDLSEGNKHSSFISSYPSIVDVKEVVVGSSLDSIFMVMEYMEHNLKALMETMKQRFKQSDVKCLMLQLLEGVKYLHDNWVLHRDLKTSNLLLNNQGELKICDFGLARQYGSPLKPYTHLVVTLWYRAPELLFGARQYSTAIDMWSLGCIMAELLSKEALFSGKTEFDQLYKIFRTLGSPNETIWPGFSKLPGVKVNFVKHQLPALGDSVLAFWLPLFPATSFTGTPVLSDAGFDFLNKLLMILRSV
ncbi:hypothetical protein V6N12_048158 [Hibiscus sabdariffa]|uniref:Protein kinase domain-containing protein n=1 Tax=Hibiscus sabdariffa TaxID=183260 RepID=A0ABR2EGF3_9ROSI